MSKNKIPNIGDALYETDGEDSFTFIGRITYIAPPPHPDDDDYGENLHHVYWLDEHGNERDLYIYGDEDPWNESVYGFIVSP